MRIIVYIWPDIDIYTMWLFFGGKLCFLVYMYYTHPSYRTSIVGKNIGYYIQIFTILTYLLSNRHDSNHETQLAHWTGHLHPTPGPRWQISTRSLTEDPTISSLPAATCIVMLSHEYSCCHDVITSQEWPLWITNQMPLKLAIKTEMMGSNKNNVRSW